MNTRDQNNRSVSLRFVVYDFFREQMKNGVLIPGSLINVREISE
ncbi:MAG: hypothetical protein XE01_1235, partial [Synergistales bacterium 58_81]